MSAVLRAQPSLAPASEPKDGGAAWIWELAGVNFPAALFILDLCHALECLQALCAGLYGEDSPWATRMADAWTAMLKNDQVGEVIAAARRRRQDVGPPPEDPLEKQIAYFERHQDKVRYKTYRQQGLFYGSGVIEGGCKSVIGRRLKRVRHVLDRGWRHQRSESAPGSQKQSLG